MASPSSRRTGFSKKQQYSVFTGYLLATLGALLGLGMLALSLWQPAALQPLRGGANDVSATVGEAPAAARAHSASLWEEISAYWNAGSENAQLRREVEIARVRLAEAEAVAAENRRLKALMGLTQGEVKPVAITRLVGSSSSSSRRFAYLGVGRSDGIEVGMPVHSESGVIGRVLETSRASSRVLLLTDNQSVLPVRRASDQTVAFAEGRGDGVLRIRLNNLGLNPLKEGDVFVTSGAGGYYRPGVAVAVLTQVTPDGGLAQLIAEPSATNYVVVEPVHQILTVETSGLNDDETLAEQLGSEGAEEQAGEEDSGE